MREKWNAGKIERGKKLTAGKIERGKSHACLHYPYYPFNVWLFSSGPEPKPEFKGEDRTFRLWLDTNQYQQDMAETVHGAEVTVASVTKTFVISMDLLDQLMSDHSDVYRSILEPVTA